MSTPLGDSAGLGARAFRLGHHKPEVRHARWVFGVALALAGAAWACDDTEAGEGCSTPQPTAMCTAVDPNGGPSGLACCLGGSFAQACVDGAWDCPGESVLTASCVGRACAAPDADAGR